MASRSQQPPPPIRRSVEVSWSQEAAFRRFTAEFGAWWPSYACSIGGPRVRRVAFECREGGQIYEEHADGTRFLWGTVTAWDPPRRVGFSWHSTRDEADAQQVEVSFVPLPGGTRVELVSSGWEKMSPEARRAYGGYRMSWKAVMDGFTGRFSGTLLFFNAMSAVINVTGQRESFVKGSRGRMPAASSHESRP
jgi:hypothetical protein